jgi:hypothetical protein
MIPCFVCGKDASASWTAGFAPSPDSQKLALCKEHDTPEQRRAVEQAWQEKQTRELAAYSLVAIQKAAHVKKLATVHFTSGGMLSFTCTDIGPTEHGTLRIEQSDGTQTFLPMHQVKEYSVRACTHEDREQEIT